jgi:hypothetical protein
MAGVAKLLDSLSHFSKFEFFCEPQLNTYLKGTQKKGIKITEIIFIENIYIKVQNVCIKFTY